MSGRVGLGFLKGGVIIVPSGIIVGWPSTNASIPTGYTRATAYDGRYVKEIATSATNPGATGGSSSHNHSYSAHSGHTYSHSHSWPTSGTASVNLQSGNTQQVSIATDTHTHPLSDPGATSTVGSGGPANYDAASVEPPNLVVIFITSNGTAGIPANALGYFNAAAPTNFAAYSNGTNRLWKGAATGGDGGGTGGTGDSHTHTSASHTHSVNAHTHSVAFGSASATVQGVSGAIGSSGNHVHPGVTSDSQASGTSDSASESTASGDMTPPWYKILTIQNTSGTPQSPPLGLIAIWDGTLVSIPAKWHLCDGTSGTPNLSQGLYVRGAASSGEVGTTGGATTHTHSGAGHTHGSSGIAAHSHGGIGASASSDINSIDSGGVATARGSHGHASGGSSSTVGIGSSTSQSISAGANSSNDPVFTAVAYIQYTG